MTSREDDDRFEESLASRPFLFIVGKERKEFHIHKEVIGQLSPALNALVNGGMREACEGRVEWPDLDVDTFVRFAKFAYSSNYIAAQPEFLLAPTSPPSSNHGGPEKQISQSSPHGSTAQADGADESFSPAEDDEDEGESQSASGSDMGTGFETSDSEDLGDADDDGIEGDDGDEGEEGEDEEAYVRNRIVSSLAYGPGRSGFGPKNPMAFSSGRSSTLSNGQPSRSDLPYSIKTYMSRWESHVKDRLALWESEPMDTMPPAKRRKLIPSDWRLESSINLRYEAMRRFTALDLPLQIACVDHWHPGPSNGADVSWEPVFLSHARLYVLAEKYGVKKLKTLALHRLHLSLASFTIYPDRVGDLVSLIHAIYENTMADDLARSVIVQFFGCVAEHVKNCGEFRVALRSEGEFADDLFQEITSRLL